jgi:hypothetical protein
MESLVQPFVVQALETCKVHQQKMTQEKSVALTK